ncbi:MAG: NUDIX hydrolase [Patescibacteria group bacterium]|nr:NUDIX hydrolase [Patescibacteria group bacterium]
MSNKKNKFPKNAKRVFKGEIFEVWQWPQKMYDGSKEIFEMLTRSDTAQVIAAVDDKILILNQRQPDSASAFLSLPGGRREKNETVLNTAKRELLEETGYVSRDWKLFKKISPSRKIVWTIHTYIARDCIYWQTPRLDAGEKITFKLISFDEFLGLADEPDFYDPELTNYMLRARFDKKIYKKFHKLLFGK